MLTGQLAMLEPQMGQAQYLNSFKSFSGAFHFFFLDNKSSTCWPALHSHCAYSIDLQVTHTNILVFFLVGCLKTRPLGTPFAGDLMARPLLSRTQSNFQNQFFQSTLNIAILRVLLDS